MGILFYLFMVYLTMLAGAQIIWLHMITEEQIGIVVERSYYNLIQETI